MRVDTVSDRFWSWDYYFVLTSPWTGRQQPGLDRQEFERRGSLISQVSAPANDCGPPFVGTVMGGQAPAATPLTASDVENAWNRNADVWDQGIAEKGDETRIYITDCSVFAFIGNVAGKDIVDLGCGNGYLSRTLARSSARVTGVDQSGAMIERALCHEATEPLGIVYHKCSITQLQPLASESIDIAVSNFVLQDVGDYSKAVSEAYRILRTGGTAVFAITHPCFSCGPRRWVFDAEDTPRQEEAAHFAVDHYFEETAYIMDDWPGFDPVPYFHRPLENYWRAFKDAGFEVMDFSEPRLSTRGRTELPVRAVSQYSRIPLACVFKLRKPPFVHLST
ncbi:class I SAM-dependent methyltransferase [Bradyrhizobium macuxiense]|nr:class I SAM-dependent methyltransferase [Bradyrhizobium macuxiense]